MQKEILSVPVDSIEPNDWNPNVMKLEEYLALKVDVEAGEYDPIIVSPFETFYGDTREKEFPHVLYVIVDGENRWKAAVEAGLTEINIEVRELTEDEAKPINYKRNRQRGTMDPLKEAYLFKSELDKPGMTQEVIGLRYNISRQFVGVRLSLLKLDEKVVGFYVEPEETFKAVKTKEYDDKVAEVEKRIETLKEEGKDESQIDMIMRYQMPDEPEAGELAPRGALTPSHLELIATLPTEEQAEISTTILERGWSVRQTEEQVQSIKNRLENERKIRKAIDSAKRRTCPQCGQGPGDFSYMANMFRCSECNFSWDYTKTQEEVDEQKRKDEARVKEERKEQARESRGKAISNPNNIRRLETPTALSDKMKPWVHKKMLELTRIREIEVEGVRLNPETGEEEYIDIRFKPARTDSANVQSGLELVVRTSSFKESGGYRHERQTNTFGFTVEGKEYKRSPDRSRVNIFYGEVNAVMRALLNAFFNDTVETDKDPWWCKEDIEKSELADVDEAEEVALEKEDYEADPLIHADTGQVLSYEEAKRLDPLLTSFTEGDLPLVEVVLADWTHDSEDTVLLLQDRIKELGLNVEAYEDEDGKVYLEKKPESRPAETDVTRRLKGTVRDGNWKTALAKATVEDLKYMLEHDDRKTAITQYRKRLRELGEDA